MQSNVTDRRDSSGRESDKRESAGAAPERLFAIIAELEAIERKLAGRATASGALELGSIENARTRIREAIVALVPLATEESSEAANSAKRRAKSKAEGTPAKSGARGGRKQPAAEAPPVPSLLARLGAVGQATSEPLAESKPKAESGALPDSTKSAPTDTSPDRPQSSPMNTAERLAQLEAEIADLTQAVTASPTKSGGTASRSASAGTAPAGPASALVLPAATPEGLDLPSDDDEDAEIVIVGAAGAPAGGRMRAGRNVPRILAEASAADDEVAEVQIRGQDSARAGRLTHAPDGARTGGEVGKGASGRWRLFRGSR